MNLIKYLLGFFCYITVIFEVGTWSSQPASYNLLGNILFSLGKIVLFNLVFNEMAKLLFTVVLLSQFPFEHEYFFCYPVFMSICTISHANYL